MRSGRRVINDVDGGFILVSVLWLLALVTLVTLVLLTTVRVIRRSFEEPPTAMPVIAILAGGRIGFLRTWMAFPSLLVFGAFA
jgi:hypothetical protein